MKKNFILLFLCSAPIILGGVSDSTPAEKAKYFEDNKSHITPELRNFVNDFATWPQEDQKKILWNPGSQTFTAHGLSSERIARYNNNLESWLNPRLQRALQQEPTSVFAFIACLKHIRGLGLFQQL